MSFFYGVTSDAVRDPHVRAILIRQEWAIVRQLLPDLPKYTAPPSSSPMTSPGISFILLITLGLLVTMGAPLALLPLVLLPGMPWQVVAGTIVVAWLLLPPGALTWAIGRFFQTMPEALRPIAVEVRHYTKQAILCYYVLSIPLVIGVFVVLLFWIQAIWGVLLLGAVLLCLNPLLSVTYLGLFPLMHTEWLYRPLQQADYRATLRRIDLMLWFSADDAVHLMHKALVLNLAGQYAEAETTVREALTQQQNRSSPEQSLGVLARGLFWQGRWAEAQQLTEALLQLNPDSPGAQNLMAELILHQEGDPSEALALVEGAIRNRGHLSNFLGRYHLLSLHINQAWALTCLGRYAEAQQALHTALMQTDNNAKLERAGLYERTGHLLLVRGEVERAGRHFQRAVAIEPDSHYGQAAARRLATLDPYAVHRPLLQWAPMAPPPPPSPNPPLETRAQTNAHQNPPDA